MKYSYSEAQQAALEMIEGQDTYAAEYMTKDWLASFIASTYQYNDLAVEITQRVGNITLIATQRKISLILESSATRYGRESGSPLCIYENLEDDLQNILNHIEACFINIIL